MCGSLKDIYFSVIVCLLWLCAVTLFKRIPNADNNVLVFICDSQKEARVTGYVVTVKEYGDVFNNVNDCR